MNDPCTESPKSPGLREQVENLNTILTEALAIEAAICGDDSSVEKVAECSEVLLDEIEVGIEVALGKAKRIISQLSHIQARF